MNRFLCIALLGLASATTLHAQSDTLKLNYSPMNGQILLSAKPTVPSAYTPNHGEYVYSKESNVYTLLPGTVTSIFSVGKDKFVMVNTGDIYIVYSGLESCNFKKGDAVKQNELIGNANYSEVDNSYKMNVQAWRTRNGKAAREDNKLLLALVQ
jgi:hypothetical protein